MSSDATLGAFIANSIGEGDGGGGASAGDMWSHESMRATFLLALAVVMEVAAGSEMKRARGFANRPAALRALALAWVCVACTIQLLSYGELSVVWAVYTLFELGGVTAAGVLVWGEAMTCFKAAGLAAALAGTVLLELQRKRGGGHSGYTAVLNLPMLIGAMLSGLLLLLFVESRRCPCAPSRLCGGARVTAAEGMADAGAALAGGAPRSGGKARAAWLYGGILLATVCEVSGAVFMKEANGFSDMGYTMLAFAVALVNVAVTIMALAHGSLAVAWALYTAAEYIGVLVIGVAFFHDGLGVVHFTGLVLTVVGVLVLVAEEEGLLGDNESDDGEELPEQPEHRVRAPRTQRSFSH